MKYSGYFSADLRVAPPALRADGHRAQKERRVYAAYLKRLGDIVLALVALPICVPLIAIFWILSRLEGGPGFYCQPRVGRFGETFTCWKLRTMVPNADKVLKDLCDRDPVLAAEWHEKQKLAKDPRITRIGRFLRATSLDELPQILNVLKGDMSFVGPRPFMTTQEALYRAAGGEAYFRMRPGITGLWQLDGRNTTAFVDRVTYDDLYWQKLSAGVDLRCLLATVRVIFRKTGQ